METSRLALAVHVRHANLRPLIKLAAGADTHSAWQTCGYGGRGDQVVPFQVLAVGFGVPSCTSLLCRNSRLSLRGSITMQNAKGSHDQITVKDLVVSRFLW